VFVLPQHRSKQLIQLPPSCCYANDTAQIVQHLKTQVTNPHPRKPYFNLIRWTTANLVVFIHSLPTNGKGIYKKYPWDTAAGWAHR